MNDIKLKRCPFCGGKAKKRVVHEDILHVKYWVICCEECDCKSSAWQDVNKAIEAWNTRKQMESMVNELNKMLQGDHGGMYDMSYERAYNNGIFDVIDMIEEGKIYE